MHLLQTRNGLAICLRCCRNFNLDPMPVVSGRQAHSDRVTPGHHLLQQADQTGHDRINIIQSPGNRESLLAGLEIMHGCVTDSGPRRRSLAIASLEPARLRCTTQICWQARARNLSMSLDHGLQDNGPRQLAPHQHRRKSMRCRQGGGGGWQGRQAPRDPTIHCSPGPSASPLLPLSSPSGTPPARRAGCWPSQTARRRHTPQKNSAANRQLPLVHIKTLQSHSGP